jgi:hypothetical protein
VPVPGLHLLVDRAQAVEREQPVDQAERGHQEDGQHDLRTYPPIGQQTQHNHTTRSPRQTRRPQPTPAGRRMR